MAEFLSLIPFASLIALVLAWIGVILFCSMMYQGVNASVEQARRILTVKMPWLDSILVTFVTVAVIMFLVALVLLVIGALATGTTRSRVYSGWKASMGGRVSCACFLLLTYVLNLLWLAILSFTVVVCFVYMVFQSLCLSVSSNQCLNFTVLTPILNGTTTQSSLVLCDSKLQEFCGLTETACTWYYVSYFGCIIVILGLIHFMITLAANYAHIKDGSKYVELQEIWQLADESQQWSSVGNNHGQGLILKPMRQPKY